MTMRGYAKSFLAALAMIVGRSPSRHGFELRLSAADLDTPHARLNWTRHEPRFQRPVLRVIAGGRTDPTPAGERRHARLRLLAGDRAA